METGLRRWSCKGHGREGWREGKGKERRRREGREFEVFGNKGVNCAAGVLGWRKQAHWQHKNGVARVRQWRYTLLNPVLRRQSQADLLGLRPVWTTDGVSG